MNREQSSQNVKEFNHKVHDFKVTLRNYLEVLNNKQSVCEYELHQLVTNTSIKFAERKNQTIDLMLEQEKISQLMDDLERILLDKGETV